MTKRWNGVSRSRSASAWPSFHRYMLNAHVSRVKSTSVNPFHSSGFKSSLNSRSVATSEWRPSSGRGPALRSSRDRAREHRVNGVMPQILLAVTFNGAVGERAQIAAQKDRRSGHAGASGDRAGFSSLVARNTSDSSHPNDPDRPARPGTTRPTCGRSTRLASMAHERRDLLAIPSYGGMATPQRCRE